MNGAGQARPWMGTGRRAGLILGVWAGKRHREAAAGGGSRRRLGAHNPHNATATGHPLQHVVHFGRTLHGLLLTHELAAARIGFDLCACRKKSAVWWHVARTRPPGMNDIFRASRVRPRGAAAAGCRRRCEMVQLASALHALYTKRATTPHTTRDHPHDWISATGCERRANGDGAGELTCP